MGMIMLISTSLATGSTFCAERSSFSMSTPIDESQESVHDGTQNHSTLIFKEDWVNHLTYKMVKGEVKVKSTGSLQQLKEFVVLILEKDGHWHPRQQGGIEVNVSDHAKSKFKLTMVVVDRDFYCSRKRKDMSGYCENGSTAGS